MPYRRIPLVPLQIYHVYNRSIGKQPIFHSVIDYNRFLSLINYYRYKNTPLRFSHFHRLPPSMRQVQEKLFLQRQSKYLDILAYCLMPNHFHFLLKGIDVNGIEAFMKKSQESYAKYFNMKYKRNGSLFQAKFKAVLIETDEQFLHVARYIHLNPYTSYLIKNIDQIFSFPWSSLREYMSNPTIIDPQSLTSHFKSKAMLQSFTLNYAEYQKKLSDIKHLIFNN